MHDRQPPGSRRPGLPGRIRLALWPALCQVESVKSKILSVGRWLVGLVLLSTIFAIGYPHNYPVPNGIDPIPNLPGIKGACPSYPPEGLFSPAYLAGGNAAVLAL